MSKTKVHQRLAGGHREEKTGQKPFYKLNTVTNHDAFVAWDNSPVCKTIKDRLCVVVTVRKLPLAEASVVARLIESIHGFDPKRELEYFRFVLVWRGNELVDVIDIDQMSRVSMPVTHRDLFNADVEYNPIPLDLEEPVPLELAGLQFMLA